MFRWQETDKELPPLNMPLVIAYEFELRPYLAIYRSNVFLDRNGNQLPETPHYWAIIPTLMAGPDWVSAIATMEGDA